MQVSAKYVFSNGELLSDTSLVIEDGIIKSLIPSNINNDFNFENCAIIPSFINTHTHSMQAMMRGFGDDTDLLDWLRGKVYRCCEYMTDDDVYLSALLSFTEMAENGITAVSDFFYLNRGNNDCAEAVIQAAKEVGIRLVLARTLMDWEDAPSCIREDISTAERNFLDLYSKYKYDDDYIRVCLAPHSAYGASRDMILLAHELSNSFNIPLHMHVSDSASAMELTRKMTGKEYVAYLNELGVLDSNFVAVHCIHCDEVAQKILSDNQVSVSHNPVSNMFLGEPAAPIVALLRSGAKIGLGTDGAASNNRLSILHEMKTCALQQKSANGNPEAITSATVFEMATKNGSDILGFKNGDIIPGNLADFIVIDLKDISLLPEKAIKSHLVYALTEKAIKSVFVGGKQIISSGKSVNVDYVSLRDKVNRKVSNWQV